MRKYSSDFAGRPCGGILQALVLDFIESDSVLPRVAVDLREIKRILDQLTVRVADIVGLIDSPGEIDAFFWERVRHFGGVQDESQQQENFEQKAFRYLIFCNFLQHRHESKAEKEARLERAERDGGYWKGRCQDRYAPLLFDIDRKVVVEYCKHMCATDGVDDGGEVTEQNRGRRDLRSILQDCMGQWKEEVSGDEFDRKAREFCLSMMDFRDYFEGKIFR